MHPDQLSVKVETVQELVANQFPEWSGLPITGIASQGTVNALFRIGDQLVARFPLQPAAVDETRRWLESEAEAARELLGRTPFATPEPVAIGEPGADFPLPWSVQTWLPEQPPPKSIRATPWHSLTTWPRSLRRCDQSTPVVAGSLDQVGVETCAPMMRGCRPASSTARISLMYRGSGECGPSYVSFRVLLPMS